MASSINASITSNGIVHTGDASGILQLQSDGTTGLTVGTSGKVSLPSIALGTASAGLIEYNGLAYYFTNAGTQRGVVPGMQYYALNSAVVGANATGAQNTLGVGVTLSASTQYMFEGTVLLSKTAGVTSHTVATAFGGTATLNNISYTLTYGYNTTSTAPANGAAMNFFTANTAQVFTAAITTATYYVWYSFKGIISVNASGTFIPQYSLSAAPGGAYTTAIGSYMSIYPIGASGANVNVGTWA
jgi:hypothetical protein